MSKVPTPEFIDDSPDVQIVPMEETGRGSTDDVYKPPQRVFKVNFSFSNDPKVQARKRKQSSPPPAKKIQTQMTDFKTASGRSVEKGQPKSVYGPKPTSSRNDDGPVGQENGARYLGGTRRAGYAPVVAPFRAPTSRKEGQEDFTDGSGASMLLKASDCLGGLKAEKSLKNFDSHIVDVIESEIMSVNNTIDWNDVAGLGAAKKTLKEIVVLPFKRPDLCKGIRAPPKGVLLFGPPGTGKTMIGRCVASQCDATFFNISASSLTSKWVGEGEKLVRALFAVARLKLPSIIFIDEIDSLLSSRSETEHESSRRIKTEFLVQLDGVSTSSDERLLVLGATNRPQELDEAARRRFAKRLYIALPEQNARIDIIKRLLSGHANTVTAEEFNEIGRKTEGYSGADMRELCIEAAKEPMRELGEDIMTVKAEEIRPIGLIDFNAALRVVRPTVIEADLTRYREWDREFGCLPPLI